MPICRRATDSRTMRLTLQRLPRAILSFLRCARARRIRDKVKFNHYVHLQPHLMGPNNRVSS